MGHRRAVPRERPVRDHVRRGVRRDRRERAADARHDRGDLEGVRDERADHRRPGARLARHQARWERGAEGAVPAEARDRRVACGVRADRARLGVGQRCDAHDRGARRRRVRPQRRQAVHHERRRCVGVRRLREDRSVERPSGHLGIRRRGGHAGVRGGADRAEDGNQGLDDRRDLLQRRAHPGNEPARRRGRGLQDRNADPRSLAAGDRRAGARPRAGRNRLRASSTRSRARRWASRSASTS